MEEESKWLAVIAQELRIRGIDSTGKACVAPVALPKATMDHRQAILKLHQEGRSRREIRDAMIAAGYFKGKSHHQIAGSIRAVLDGYGKRPPAREDRVDEMLRHAATMQKKKVFL